MVWENVLGFPSEVRDKASAGNGFRCFPTVTEYLSEDILLIEKPYIVDEAPKRLSCLEERRELPSTGRKLP